MIKFDLDQSKTECKQAVIWCLGTYDVICKKYIKIQQYWHNKDFDIINIFGIISKNIDNERTNFKKMLEFVKREKEKTAIVMYDNKQLPQLPFLKNELMNLVTKNQIELHYVNDRIRLSSIK